MLPADDAENGEFLREQMEVMCGELPASKKRKK